MYMKKLFAIISSLALAFSCFACDEEKQDEDSTEEVSDTEITPDTGNTAVENQFRTYAESDFKKINVPLKYTEDEPPVALKSFDIPDLDFGERISPCKQSDDPSQYDPMLGQSGRYAYRWTDENGVEHISESTYMKILDIPEKGMIHGAAYADNKIYFTVSYDNFCIGCHEWSIYEYDMASKAVKEVYNFSGTDNEYEVGVWIEPTIIDNKLLISCWQPVEYDNPEHKRNFKIVAIDLSTGSDKVIYESNGDAFPRTGKDKVQFCETKSTDDSHRTVSLTIREYDMKTGDIKTITENEETKIYSSVISELSAYVRKPADKRQCELVTEKYCIQTSITNADVVYASDKKAIVVTDGDKSIMHTYDLEKMEHYVTDFGGENGQFAAYGENIIYGDTRNVGDSMANIYCIVPEMGITFTLSEGISFDMLKTSNGTVSFNHTEQEYMSINADDSFKRGYNKPVTVYWIEDKE